MVSAELTGVPAELEGDDSEGLLCADALALEFDGFLCWM
jgi:hypothetical protein